MRAKRARAAVRLDGQGDILGFHIAVAAPLILEAQYPGRVLPDGVQVVPLGMDTEQVLLRPMLHIPAAERHLHPNGGVVAIVEIAEVFKNIPLILRRSQTVVDVLRWSWRKSAHLTGTVRPGTYCGRGCCPEPYGLSRPPWPGGPPPRSAFARRGSAYDWALLFFRVLPFLPAIFFTSCSSSYCRTRAE